MRRFRAGQGACRKEIRMPRPAHLSNLARRTGFWICDAVDFQQVISLVVILVVLAALPRASVLLVIALSPANRFRHDRSGCRPACPDAGCTLPATAATAPPTAARGRRVRSAPGW